MSKNNFFKTYSYFLVPFVLWILIAFFTLLKIDKGDLVLFFNDNRTIVGNFYFIIASAFAEWKVILFILAILLSKKFGNAFIVALTWFATGIIAQSLKRMFDAPRPPAFFKNLDLNFITDNIHFAHSFPSGHTTTAFALFFVLAMMSEKKILQFVFFLLALSTAISRVYLLQHFLVDVFFGSILGVVIGWFMFIFISKSNIFGFQKWKNKGLRK